MEHFETVVPYVVLYPSHTTLVTTMKRLVTKRFQAVAKSASMVADLLVTIVIARLQLVYQNLLATIFIGCYGDKQITGDLGY